MQSPIPILYEDNHLLIVNKPAGLTTQGALPDQPSVHSLMSRFMKAREQKPGNVYLGIVSRLDSGTSGVLPIAKTSKSAARLSEQIRERRVEKIYLGVLEGILPPARDRWIEWQDFVIKDESLQRMKVVEATHAGAQSATLRLRVVQSHADRTLIIARLMTGRKHQIRLQAAVRGFPVIGDSKYGNHRWGQQDMALHAVFLRLEHPTRKEPMQFVASAPDSWQRFGIAIPSMTEIQRFLDP